MTLDEKRKKRGGGVVLHYISRLLVPFIYFHSSHYYPSVTVDQFFGDSPTKEAVNFDLTVVPYHHITTVLII